MVYTLMSDDASEKGSQGISGTALLMPGAMSFQVPLKVAYDRRLPLSRCFVRSADEGLRVQYDSSITLLQDEARSIPCERPLGRHAPMLTMMVVLLNSNSHGELWLINRQRP